MLSSPFVNLDSNRLLRYTTMRIQLLTSLSGILTLSTPMYASPLANTLSSSITTPAYVVPRADYNRILTCTPNPPRPDICTLRTSYAAHPWPPKAVAWVQDPIVNMLHSAVFNLHQVTLRYSYLYPTVRVGRSRRYKSKSLEKRLHSGMLSETRWFTSEIRGRKGRRDSAGVFTMVGALLVW